MTSEPLRLSVVGGTGNEGRGIAMRFAMTGADVVIGSRDATRAVETATTLSTRLSGGTISGASNADAIASTDIIVLSVPFAHAADIVHASRDAFRSGALVIDVTVPLVFEGGKPRLVPPPEGSAAEHLRAKLPERVQLACAFKTMPAHLLEHVDEPLDCDEFVCGDSKDVRDRTMALLQRIPGLRAIDTGPLEAARALERMTWLAILINKRYKTRQGRFKVLGLGEP